MSQHDIHGKLHHLTDALRAAVQVIAEIERELSQLGGDPATPAAPFPFRDPIDAGTGLPNTPIYPHIAQTQVESQVDNEPDEESPAAGAGGTGAVPDENPVFGSRQGPPQPPWEGAMVPPSPAAGTIPPPGPWSPPHWAYLLPPWAWQAAPLWWQALFGGWSLGAAPPWAGHPYGWGVGQGMSPQSYASWPPAGVPWWGAVPPTWPAGGAWPLAPQNPDEPAARRSAPSEQKPADEPESETGDPVESAAAAVNEIPRGAERSGRTSEAPPVHREPATDASAETATPAPEAPPDRWTWRWNNPEDIGDSGRKPSGGR